MYPKVRCTGCNKVIGDMWTDFSNDYKAVVNHDYTEVWKKYDIKRVCCRNSLLSNVEAWKKFIIV